jgi:hypothetical protein
MAAATLLAARQSKLQLASNQQETYSIATLINCRKFLEPALDDHNVGEPLHLLLTLVTMQDTAH